MAIGAVVRLIAIEQRLHSIRPRGQTAETSNRVAERRPINGAAATWHPVLHVDTEDLGRLGTVVHQEPWLAFGRRGDQDKKAALECLARDAFRYGDLEPERRLDCGDLSHAFLGAQGMPAPNRENDA